MKGYIYLIENKINQSKYIGKTYQTVEQRWNEHCKDYKRECYQHRPLYNAMTKYGVENFTIQEIEYTDNCEEREKYWIKFYNSYYNGYNATIGGEGRKEYEALIFVENYQSGLTETEIATKYKCDMSTVRKALNLYNICPNKEQQKRAKEQYGKKCCCIKDDIIMEFSTMMEAARFIKDNNLSVDTVSGIQTHIGQVCNGKRKTAYGYKWQYMN